MVAKALAGEGVADVQFNFVAGQRFERVVQRSHLPRAQIQSIIDAQASRAQRCAVADAVLFNDGISLSALEGQVQAFAHRFGL